MAADLAAQTLALENLAGKIDIASPQMPMKQLSLAHQPASCAPTWPSKAPRWNSARRFDESKIALKLDVAKFAPLALGFELDIDQLNVEKYLSARQRNKPAQKAPRRRQARLLRRSRATTCTAGIRIGALQASKLKLATSSMPRSGSPAAASMWRRSASIFTMAVPPAASSLNANGNQLALKQNLAGISINPLMKDLADKDLLEGRGNVALDVSQPRRKRHGNEEGAGRQQPR
ncbi:MAG: hypothetical protein V9G29_19345 [Burkholderiaceae bacterium]